MTTTIRGIDEETFRRLKAHAALRGKTIGETVNEALRAYLARRPAEEARGSLADWHPMPFPPGNERLSEEIDAVLYGG